MSLKHFTNEFNTPYAQKPDKTEAHLGKNIQLSARELLSHSKFCFHKVALGRKVLPSAELPVAKSSFSAYMAQSVMKMATLLSYIFLMLPQSGWHHPWHHEP